ncbi:APC membrane recruitment protein 3 [Myxocyprinus asiaticus]|uniref:APC membrane recruitment protein 3 n=1 Tax=Myxocyprinus asiaticus TaxID=70543 RepID=UPI00222308EB|nr:APC membrane recruitment protein 3 [Myxocyprinus asiaticus]
MALQPYKCSVTGHAVCCECSPGPLLIVIIFTRSLTARASYLVTRVWTTISRQATSVTFCSDTELSDTLSESNGQLCSSVTRSRTHECVRGIRLQQAESPGYKDRTNWRHHYKLVTSVSFPPQLLRENRDTSGSSHEIIDYCNLTPQVPFVPCIAKSIPIKRISLRKPKKATKDLLVHKRNNHEKAMSPGTPCRVAGENVPTVNRTKKSLRHRGSRYDHELSETFSDSSGENCANVCDDAASLKSFGSQAGCGEIFADKECLICPECEKVACGPQRQSPTSAGLQGGKECLASPVHVEDMFGMWETLNRNIIGQSSRSGGNATETKTPIANSPKTVSENESQIRELNPDVITPKSDNQENTSDEGYCDYVSPGFEDHSKSSLTPVHSNKFTRDTYSGDALYELFYDPSEAEMTPIFDDEIDLTDSIAGQCSDLPLSMYSFHVGAEENLAPPLARDVIGQELLQSKWMGKDCLLKLCDTEISLAMGIVNWLKQRTENSNPTELRSSQTSSAETGDLCLRCKTQSAGVRKPPRRAPPRTCNGRKDMLNFTKKDPNQPSFVVPLMHLPSQCDVNTVMSTLASPERLPQTPVSGVCFRIYNIDSPVTPSGDLQSPVVSSPGSGTRSLFVLAINKQSLCESCRSSLRNGAKDLYLCPSCMSLIEHIKTSDLWACASLPQSKTLNPQPITGDLLSPASTCGIGSDISIASLVEQCASQLASMKINITQKHLSCEKRGVFEPEQGVKRNKEQKSLKSKHKKRPMTTTEKGSHARHCMRRSSLSEDVHKSSLLKTEGLGFVTTNGSDDLMLETYSPCTDTSQATRPTSLPLMASISSISSYCREDHHIQHLNMMENGNPAKKKRGSQHHRKSAVNIDESSGFVLPREKKVERRCKMKK